MPSLPSTLNHLTARLASAASSSSIHQAEAHAHALLTRRNALTEAFTIPVILGALTAIIFCIGLGCMIKICLTPNPYDGTGALKK